MWFIVIIFASLPSLYLSEISCPDGNKCPDGKQCCSVSPSSFECCEVRKYLMLEMEVAGREHFLGMPSEYGRNHSTNPCRSSTCEGTCCDTFCCKHRSAECCGTAHQCCKVGYKCCGGNRAWCCPWKLSCSSAQGYCISPAKPMIIPKMDATFFVILLLFFCGL